LPKPTHAWSKARRRPLPPPARGQG
jgi:hypothetical protein